MKTGPARRETWTKSDNWDTVGVSSGTKRVINLPNWSSRFNFDPHSRTMPTSRTCLFNYPPSQLILPFFAIWVKKVNLFFLFRVLMWNIKLRFIQIVKLGERNLIWYNLAELYRNEFIFSLIRKYFLRENEFCFSVEFRSVSEENGYWNIGYIFGKLLKIEDIIIDPLKITIFSHLYS